MNKIDSSYETINLLVRKVIEWAVESPDALPGDMQASVNEALDTVIGWGDACLFDQVCSRTAVRHASHGFTIHPIM